MAKKKSPHHEKNLTALNGFVSFLVLVLAFSLLLLFKEYKDAIFNSGNFNLFMLLAVSGFALLISLLFLINKKK